MTFFKYLASQHESDLTSWLCSESPQFYWPRDLLRSQLQSTESFVWVEASSVVGVISFQKLQPDLWELQLVAIHPSWRGKALGAQLVRKALQELCVLNDNRLVAEVWLEVHEGNLAAQALYRRLGFLDVGRRSRYYRDGGAAVLMAAKPGSLISS